MRRYSCYNYFYHATVLCYFLALVVERDIVFCLSVFGLKSFELMWFFSRALKLVSSTSPQTSPKTDSNILFAMKKIEKLLSKNGATFSDICFAIESSETKNELHAAFQPFNRIMRIIRIAVPDQEQNSGIVSAIKSLKCSERLSFHMESTSSIHDAIISYKSAVAMKMEASYQRRQQLRICDDAFDNSLLTCNLASTFEDGKMRCGFVGRKRSISQVTGIDGEYCGDQSNFCLGLKSSQDLRSKKKQCTIKNQLTDLLKKQCSGFTDKGSTDTRVPKFKVVKSSKKKTWWDDS